MRPFTPYPITPIGNFIGVLLALLPLFSQIRKLSLAVWGYAIWISLYCFQMFVNSIVWHDNVDIVAPVWCDIAIKLQIGASVGTRICTLVICAQLYRITRLRGPLRRKIMAYELSMIAGLPVVIMALFIIVQPARFAITEEAGCTPVDYSYVTYIIYYGPPILANVVCAILAPLTLRTFIRHRKDINEFLTTDQDLTASKYGRLMIIACVDTIFNLPLLLAIVIVEILQGPENSLNYPYISWKNVHDGLGGNDPGLSLSSIIQTPASIWGSDSWTIFTVKWNEWVYVLHAIIFFCVFGTTPEMLSYFRTAFWFIPKRFGYGGRNDISTVESTTSDVAFRSDSNPRADNILATHQ
ncbi:fungal pheromone STE3G-protein-coupled receptor [Schizopora paradoxa]|uniref:Fungal pheromone STE3G-protein-coupled receptor n=1 Tax=Schizopora paradoxa TaxID=27342 RepID=A0A0H2RC99_9AGAM|nr:fungal pheromone STE3G-protein-coupled receptor [Schizopora paradoxa]